MAEPLATGAPGARALLVFTHDDRREEVCIALRLFQERASPSDADVLARARFWVAGGELGFTLAEVAAMDAAPREALLQLLGQVATGSATNVTRWLARYRHGTAARGEALRALQAEDPARWANTVRGVLDASPSVVVAARELEVPKRTLYHWMDALGRMRP